MKESKKTIEWLFFLVIYGIAIIVQYILKLGFHIRYDNPIYRGVIASILIIGAMAFFLYLWRTDVSGFSKRLLIATPFALLFGLLMITLTEIVVAASSALTVYFFLLYKTQKWKQHFLITLVLAFILAMIFKFSFSREMIESIPRNLKMFWTLFPISFIVPISFSYGLYIRELSYGKTIDLRTVFVKTLKFTAVFILYFAAFIVLIHMCMRRLISFPASFSINVILGIIFLVIVYSFGLMAVARKKKTKKKNKIDELQNELSDTYLEEYEKLKGKNCNQ